VNFYPYEFLQYSSDLFKNVKNVQYKLSLDIFNNKFNNLADVVIPVKSAYEKNESYVSLDGKIIKTKKLVNDNNNLITEVAFFNRLLNCENMSAVADLNKIFNNIDDSIIFEQFENNDNSVNYIISNNMQLNKCEYKYKLVEVPGKDVYINQRYHNGLTTEYAYRTFEDSDFEKTYFAPDYEDEEKIIQRTLFAKGITIHLKKYI
jgi:anaerobic selenocysteine-containing dehydrogenase